MKLVSFLPLLGVLATPTAFADTTPTPSASQCVILRMAKAEVIINKHYWEQDSGIWVDKSISVARANTEVPVLKDSTAGCSLPLVLQIDNVMLNGQAQTVNSYAYITVQTTAVAPQPNNKIFSASFWLSSESGSSYGSAYTPDLSTKQMGLNFTNNRDSTSPHADYLSDTVWFEDAGN